MPIVLVDDVEIDDRFDRLWLPGLVTLLDEIVRISEMIEDRRELPDRLTDSKVDKMNVRHLIFHALPDQIDKFRSTEDGQRRPRISRRIERIGKLVCGRHLTAEYRYWVACEKYRARLGEKQPYIPRWTLTADEVLAFRFARIDLAGAEPTAEKRPVASGEEVGREPAAEIEAHTLGELSDALLTQAQARLSRRPFQTIDWAGEDRLAEIAEEYSGSRLDLDVVNFLAQWVEPRLRRLGQPDPKAVTILQAIDLFVGAADLHCPNCGDRHADGDAGRWCARCRGEHAAGYRATMAPLISILRMADRETSTGRLYYELALVQEVDREIRYRARQRFGHAKFTAETFGELLDWLTIEHASEGDVAGMLRSRVIELLRADAKPATTTPEQRQESNANDESSSKTYAVIASRRMLNTALGVSASNPNHLEKRSPDGELNLDIRGESNRKTFAVTMTDPALHRQLVIDIAKLQGRNPPETSV